MNVRKHSIIILGIIFISALCSCNQNEYSDNQSISSITTQSDLNRNDSKNNGIIEESIIDEETESVSSRYVRLENTISRFVRDNKTEDSEYRYPNGDLDITSGRQLDELIFSSILYSLEYPYDYDYGDLEFVDNRFFANSLIIPINIFKGTYTVENDKYIFNYNEFEAINHDTSFITKITDKATDSRGKQATIQRMKDLNETGDYVFTLQPSSYYDKDVDWRKRFPIIMVNRKHEDYYPTLYSYDDFLCVDTYGFTFSEKYSYGESFELTYSYNALINDDDYQDEDYRREEVKKCLNSHLAFNSDSVEEDYMETNILFSDGKWEWCNNKGKLINNGPYYESEEYKGLIVMEVDQSSKVKSVYYRYDPPAYLLLYFHDDKVYYPAFIKENKELLNGKVINTDIFTKSDDSSQVETVIKDINYTDAYYQYVKETLIPQYGLSENGTINMEFGSAPNYSLLSGILDAEIIEKDGQSLLLVYVFNKASKQPKLEIQLYSYENEIKKIDSFVCELDEYTINLKLGWCNDKLVIDHYRHYNYMSSSFGSSLVILELKNKKFHELYCLKDTHAMGGINSIWNNVDNTVYFETSDGSTSGLTEAIDRIANDLSDLITIHISVSGDFLMNYEVEYSNPLVVFKLDEPIEYLSDFKNIIQKY